MLPASEIRTRADLMTIARGYGLTLRRSGSQWTGRCPFHREKTASFFIHPAKQMYMCHGCGAAGDVFTFVREMERLPGFGEAAKRVAELAGVALADDGQTAEERAERARKRAEAEKIAAEAEMFWIRARQTLSGFAGEIYRLDAEASRWCWAHPDGSEGDHERAWLIFAVLTPEADRITKSLERLDRSTREARIKAYAAVRTAKLARRLKREIQECEEFAADVVSALATGAA